jgi:Protein of unknown function (DUF3396)
LPFKRMEYGSLREGLRWSGFNVDQFQRVLHAIERGEVDFLQLIPFEKYEPSARFYNTSLTVHWTSAVGRPSNQQISPVEAKFGRAGAVTITYPTKRFSRGLESSFQRDLLITIRRLFVSQKLYWAFINQGYRPRSSLSVGADEVFIQTRNQFPLTSFDAFHTHLGFWRELVKGAFWANFLNQTHVQALGGLKQIIEEKPCSVVEGLGDGGVLLQVGPSPLPSDNEKAVHDYQRLRRFLGPILMETPDDMMKIQDKILGSWRPSNEAQRKWEQEMDRLKERYP